jgi:hypothetical protein
MRTMLSTVAVGATLMAGVVSAAGARAATSPVVGRPVVATQCTAGTWVQTRANVTSAMVNGKFLADTIVSSTDAWAVGEYYNDNTGDGSLWEHWTGGSSWSVISSGGSGVQLDAVTNFGANNVWAAGYLRNGQIDTPVISSWNGVKIVRATLPLQGTFSFLTAISGSSETDIWASGGWIDSNHDRHILLYHYNGTTWSLASAPAARADTVGIVDPSPSNVYMVVTLLKKVNVYHYNGVAWSSYLSNVPIDFESSSPAFAGSSGNDLYGIDSNEEGVDHWNGSAWSHVGSFNSGDSLDGIAEGPAGTIWSGGVLNASSGRQLYVAENGVRQTNPPAIMTQNAVMNGVASSSGLVIAVGGQENDALPNSEPIVVMSCN